MLRQILLPDGNNLAVEQIIFDDTKIMIEIISTQPAAVCPDCQQQSVRVHSRYMRTIADLAWADKQFELHWQARRFFCNVASCPRKTFMERRPALVH
jgi:transposase